MNALLFCNEILKEKLEAVINDQFVGCNLITICRLSEFKPSSYKKLKQVFIHVQLDWYSDISINQGYELAVALLNDSLIKTNFIQVRFFSIDSQKDLINEERGNHYFIRRLFQHIHILGDTFPIFEDYSREHYEFVKLLTLNNSGILLHVKHELSRILKNISDEPQKLASQKMLVQKHLSSVSFSKSSLSRYFATNIQDLLEADFRIYLAELEYEIDLLNLKQFGIKKVKKLNYSVLIVEDDQEILDILVAVFEENFRYVYPSKKEMDNYSVEKAREKLRRNGNDFNVIIIDILFEKKDTSYELFSGIDLLTDVRSKFPFLITRVITNVSRQVIGPILEIPITNLYPKNMGNFALREFIANDILRIEQDCLEKEISKRLRNEGPEIGFFDFPGVWDVLEALINSGEFYNFWEKTGKKNFDDFQRNGSIENFEGTLPKPGDKRKRVYSTQEIEKYLKSIFTFRLLFLDHFIKHSTKGSIEAGDIEIFESDVLNPICNRKYCDTSFLNMIAISASRNPRDLSFKLMSQNKLFKPEIEWMADEVQMNSGLLVLDENPELAEWFAKAAEHVADKLGINFLDISKNNLDFHTLNKFLEEIIDSEYLRETDVERLEEFYNLENVSDVVLRKEKPSIIKKIDLLFQMFL